MAFVCSDTEDSLPTHCKPSVGILTYICSPVVGFKSHDGGVKSHIEGIKSHTGGTDIYCLQNRER